MSSSESITLKLFMMDPQQRKLLEVTFECFENSGTSLTEVSGSNTGVFVGNFSQDHLLMQVRDPDDLRRYHATGAGLTMLANRISHTFNLHGPSLTLDTACSSSIYCLHLACSALKLSQCDAAIVAASNLIMAPTPHLAAMKAGMLSPTSTCHSFDISADGYARGEGINAIYLKRLSSAIKNRDNIYGVIRGTAINSNGRTPGMVYPSSDLQEVAIQRAYQEANLDPSGTNYVECHGTGTELGDKVELTALGSFFSRDGTNPLKVGGNKWNLGHSEAASGLTSLIKVCLNFEHNMLAPTCGVQMLNPKLNLSDHNMEVVTEARRWPQSMQRASICSFGYGGANAHAILESYSAYTNQSVSSKCQNGKLETQCLVLPISAASPKALEGRLDQMSRLLDRCTSDNVEQLCYTLAERVNHFKFRSALLVSSKENVGERQYGVEPVESFGLEHDASLDIAFVFNGQGAQYHAMGKELLDNNAVFLATIRKLDEVLKGLPSLYAPDWTLEDTLRGLCNPHQIHEVCRSQAVCVSVQIGLVDVLESWGIRAAATCGHSSGEIAAAYASGIISAPQAVITAFFRGYAVGNEPSHGGAMLACGLSIEQAELLINDLGYSEQVCIACVNSAESVTISGLEECIKTIKAELNSRRCFCRLLTTGGQAYHSSYMRAAGAKYESLLAPYFQCEMEQRGSSFKATMYSTVEHGINGPMVVDESALNMPRYWRNNLESPVLFEPTLSHVLKTKTFRVLEVGPHSTLKGPIGQIHAAVNLNMQYLPTLVRHHDANASMNILAAKLFIHGYKLNWGAVNRVMEHNRSVFRNLPPYPWDYSSGLRWFEPRSSTEMRNRNHIRHELLGSQQLTGNGVDWAWRNVLRVDEMPWLRDHNIDNQIIFPAAGYLTVAMEAVSQITDKRDIPIEPDYLFEFRNVSISTALVLPEKDDIQAPIKLHTTMSSRRLSSKKVSSNIYDFSISSWIAGNGSVHCVGSIKVLNSSWEKTAPLPITKNEHVQEWGMEKWHERYMAEGMFFGLHFRMLTGVRSDRDHLRPCVECTTVDHPSKLEASATVYPVHPLTIDACLQAAQISATCGNPDLFEVHVPVFISECRIRRRPISSSGDNRQGIVRAHSRRTGFATLRADCVLEDSYGTPLIEIRDVQLLKYMGKVKDTETTADQPTIRHTTFKICWKPDIGRLTLEDAETLGSQIESIIQRSNPTSLEEEVAITFGFLLDLAGHKNPRMRVLEIGASDERARNAWLKMLGQDTDFARLQSWDAIDSSTTSDSLRDKVTGTADNVLVSHLNDALDLGAYPPDHLEYLLRQSGIVIARYSRTALEMLSMGGFLNIPIRDQVILAVRKSGDKIKRQRVIILTREPSLATQQLATKLEDFFTVSGASKVQTLSIGQIKEEVLSGDVVCISLLEVERPFLATLTQESLNALHTLTNTAKHIIWLTGANILGVPSPDVTLVHGLSRSLMVEQPSLRFAVLDIGPIEAFADDFSNLCDIIKRVLVTYDGDDHEFVYSKGILNISRFEPNVTLNPLLQHRNLQRDSLHKLPLSAAHPARLSIGKVGLTDTLHFQQLCEPSTPLPPDHIDVQMKVVSLNAKDIYTMSGHVETRTGTSALEFGGIVIATGSNVTNVSVGDRVVVVTPNRFSTVERVPSWTAHRLLAHEEFGIMASLPTIYCAALYAVRDRAQLHNGESVLIHSGAGAFGIAAIAIAQRTGAVIYTTAGSEKRRKYLEESLNIPASHIFHSRDDSFVYDLKLATKGRGVDVVINSLTGDLMHDSWRCLAPFGRFVEVGKRELVDDGRLEMSVFASSATFTAFDLSDMYFQDGEYYEKVVTRLVEDVFELYRANQIQAVPIKQYDVADIVQAYRFFSSKDRIGKVVVSLENEKSIVPVVAPRYFTILNRNKVYLLVGALGGLGRSLVKWMVSRGANTFVFLQRSGLDKTGVKEFVDSLTQSGVRSTVVKGDVADLDDVVASVAACHDFGAPLGGVVQAAMALHEDLFSSMTSDGWHASVRPKWAGTWNLHTAIDGHDAELDFFLMTSSMNGSVGIPTESNYCAANSFLDTFALWRRSQGKPAVSLAFGMISEVGYLHENPEIEARLLRKGIQPLDEKTMLQLVDLALGASASAKLSSQELPAHILTGLETTSIQRLHSQGFEASHSVLDDPRSAILAKALETSLNAGRSSQTRGSAVEGDAQNIAWLKGMPEVVAKALRTEVHKASTLREAILGALQQQFSHLLLTPADQIEPTRSFAQYGIDSMIAAEFRAWIWSSLKVEVPFLDLLSSRKSLHTLTGLLEEHLTKELSPGKVS
ncbi:polyketide synthase-like protein [Nemania sp. FL0031]|nr:polyketide synthase-like protein [Nemania sp. FL0031]